MATFTFFDEWKSTVATTANNSTDVFKFFLTNTAPNVATNTVKADFTPMTTNLVANEVTITQSWSETGAGTGIWRFAASADPVWTSTTGTTGSFRYVVLYDDTLTSPGTDPVVGYFDYGSSITLDGTASETFTLNLDANNEIYTLDG